MPEEQEMKSRLLQGLEKLKRPVGLSQSDELYTLVKGLDARDFSPDTMFLAAQVCLFVVLLYCMCVVLC